MIITRGEFLRYLAGLLTSLLGWRFFRSGPRVHSLLLNRFHIAGFRYYLGQQLVHRLRVGDELTLVAEPDNPYDANAVEIYWGDAKLGYVPRNENATISRLLPQEAPLLCRIVAVDPDAVPWEMVEVEVRMEVQEATQPTGFPPRRSGLSAKRTDWLGVW